MPKKCPKNAPKMPQKCPKNAPKMPPKCPKKYPQKKFKKKYFILLEYFLIN
jgi:hypothetical protein